MRSRMIGMTFMTCVLLFLGVVGVKLSYQALVDPPIDQSTGNWVHVPSTILPTKKVIYAKKDLITKALDSSKNGHKGYRKEPDKTDSLNRKFVKRCARSIGHLLQRSNDGHMRR